MLPSPLLKGKRIPLPASLRAEKGTGIEPIPPVNNYGAPRLPPAPAAV